LAGGNTEQQGITDLTGRTGHRNTYGFFTHKKAADSIRDTVRPDKVFRLAKRLGEIIRWLSGGIVSLDFSWNVFGGWIGLPAGYEKIIKPDSCFRRGWLRPGNRVGAVGCRVAHRQTGG
jgi:hypothetical protein